MDLTESIAPRSDQLNADDLMAGPRVVTISEVRRGTAEQPVDVVTAEFGPGRPYKPSKSMRRVMVAAWGPDSSGYLGRQLRLYRDPNIRFGKDEVGGIRISHLSHIDKPLTIALTVTRGKRMPYKVEPLPQQVRQPERDWGTEAADLTSREDANRLWSEAAAAGALTDDLKALITARVEDLKADAETANAAQEAQR